METNTYWKESENGEETWLYHIRENDALWISPGDLKILSTAKSFFESENDKFIQITAQEFQQAIWKVYDKIDLQQYW